MFSLSQMSGLVWRAITHIRFPQMAPYEMKTMRLTPCDLRNGPNKLSNDLHRCHERQRFSCLLITTMPFSHAQRGRKTRESSPRDARACQAGVLMCSRFLAAAHLATCNDENGKAATQKILLTRLRRSCHLSGCWEEI